MSGPIALLTNVPISPDAYWAFIRAVGQVIDEESFWGHASDGEAYVSISLDGDDVTDLDVDEQEQLAARLDGKPRGGIVLEIPQAPGSNELALRVAERFAERWPLVIDNAAGRIFTLDEARRALEEHGTLWPE